MLGLASKHATIAIREEIMSDTHVEDRPHNSLRGQVSEAEWETRVALAAGCRINKPTQVSRNHSHGQHLQRGFMARQRIASLAKSLRFSATTLMQRGRAGWPSANI